MRQDARYWNEGYRAGLRGMSLAARRYPAGSTASWVMGTRMFQKDALV